MVIHLGMLDTTISLEGSYFKINHIFKQRVNLTLQKLLPHLKRVNLTLSKPAMILAFKGCMLRRRWWRRSIRLKRTT